MHENSNEIEMNEIKRRINLLRNKMEEKGFTWYLIPTADFHNSEYVNDYFKVREYFSAFTGSNGTLLISNEMAGLWTDGRYFIQAEQEMNGSGIELFRMMEEGVPTIQEYLEAHVKNGDILGVDGRVITATFGKNLTTILNKKNAKISYREDIADTIWSDRPKLPHNEAFLLRDEIAGESITSKLDKVRKYIEETDSDIHVLSKLDDIMWLYNIRGKDIPCNPVALAYTIIEKDKAILFIQKDVIKIEDRKYLSEHHVQIEEYELFYEVLENKIKNRTVLLDEKNVNFTLLQLVEKYNKIVNLSNPTEKLKALKNPIEIKNMREVYVKDSVIVTKFIYWIKRKVKEEKLTEYNAAEYLDQLRSEIPEFLDLSFETISAYKENAAMMHYTATKETAKELSAEGFLLVDSGGQYLGGTTDVTRTISLGNLTEKEKTHYTYACIGMLNLLNAHFMYGCTGRNLDILAREPLWRIDIDYKCGTGHGIGYILNVHEGPQSIRWRYTQQSDEAIFEEGMIVSNEPGVYIEGEYGIRIENIMLCRKGNKNGDGQFMYFEPLTYVPLDKSALDVSLITQQDRDRINDYHRQVYNKISPYLKDEEKIWLQEETRAI